MEFKDDKIILNPLVEKYGADKVLDMINESDEGEEGIPTPEEVAQSYSATMSDNYESIVALLKDTEKDIASSLCSELGQGLANGRTFFWYIKFDEEDQPVVTITGSKDSPEPVSVSIKAITADSNHLYVVQQSPQGRTEFVPFSVEMTSYNWFGVLQKLSAVIAKGQFDIVQM